MTRLHYSSKLLCLLQTVITSLAACLLLVQPTMAHQQKEAFTSLSFNSRNNSLEIVHRFYIHDAEHGLGKLFKNKMDLVSDAEAQAAFGAYIEKHFQIRTLASDKPLTIDFIGYEAEGRFLWVYQEIPNFTVKDTLHGQSNLPKPHGLKVRMDALQELWRRQTNLISVETDERVNPSVRIKYRDHWRTIYF